MLSEFGSHDSADLDLESTIVYVYREAARKPETLSIQQLAQRVRDVKPHCGEEYVREKTFQLAGKGLLRGCVGRFRTPIAEQQVFRSA